MDIGYIPIPTPSPGFGGAVNTGTNAIRSTASAGGMGSSSGSSIGGDVAGANLGSKAGSGFGFNLGTLDMAISGLGTIGNLWNAFQAQKLAKEQFKFQKEFAQKNLANQVKAYNTTLSDRGRSRAAVEGQSAETAAAYIRDNQLTA